MKKIWIFQGLMVLLMAFTTGCKSEFEQIRTSGDANLMLEKAHAYYEAEDYLRAQTLYELIISSFRGQQESEKISFNYAYTYYYLEQYVLAAYYFKNFSTTYGASSFQEEAEFMAAYSNYKLSPTFRLDQSYTQTAIDAFQEFVNRHPGSDRVVECNRLIDEMRLKQETKEFESAKLYFDLQQYQSAIRSFDNLLIEYPDTRRGEEVRYNAVRAAYLLADNSFVEKQEERFTEAIERAELFLARYSNSDYIGEVKKMLLDSQKQLKQLEDVRHQEQSSGSRS
ncbi:MAG: outer membrane protein assembly factor BamD [Saprospiraceae bacterium]